MRTLNLISTFILFALAATLFAYITLLIISFSGVLASVPVTLGRVGFYAIPLTLGTLAGLVAVSMNSSKAIGTGR